MRRIVLSTVMVALVGSLMAGPARAQLDNRALYDRIDQLQRDINTLQANQARGGGATVITSPAAGGAAARPMTGAAAAQFDDKLDQLEDQVRQLTGKLEEVTFRNQQLSKQLERMQADIDLRFKELSANQGAPAASAQAAPPPPATAPNGAPVLTPPKGLGSNAAGESGPAPGPSVLGAEVKKAGSQTPAPKDPQGLYDEAYANAQKGDYAAAEKGFLAFQQQYPNHQLAGNAAYWLGDIAYTRKDYNSSARTFAEAYKKFPKHTKAPDMLFKLGESFAALDMKPEACKTIALLFANHPDMPDRIKRAATADKTKLACK